MFNFKVLETRENVRLWAFDSLGLEFCVSVLVVVVVSCCFLAMLFFCCCLIARRGGLLYQATYNSSCFLCLVPLDAVFKLDAGAAENVQSTANGKIDLAVAQLLDEFQILD